MNRKRFSRQGSICKGLGQGLGWGANDTERLIEVVELDHPLQESVGRRQGPDPLLYLCVDFVFYP